MSDTENAETELEYETDNVSENALRNNRKTKLAQLTRRMNIIKEFMKDGKCIDEVKENMLKYRELLEVFENIHGEYQRVLKASERNTNQEMWYAPKRDGNHTFMKEVEQWLNEQEEDVISPDDSASKNAVGSRISQTSSALRCAAAEKAALEIKLAALKEKHAIEREGEELAKKQEDLKKQKEMLALISELDAANAKVIVLSETKSKVSAADGMNEHLEKALKLQESKESIGKEPDELKLEKEHEHSRC